MATDTPFKPRRAPMRSPTGNAMENGRIQNPPRYPEIGGFTSAGKGFKNNKYKIRKPGDTL